MVGIAAGVVVEEIWRYPVKSLRGESVDQASVNSRGVLGDRLWAVRDNDGKLGSGKNTRRFKRFPGPPLLTLSARFHNEPTEQEIDPPFVVGRDGREHSVQDGTADLLLRHHTGVSTLSVMRESDVNHFDQDPISLIGRATLRWSAGAAPGEAVDARRFRPNLVVRTDNPFDEECWLDRRVVIGDGQDAVEIVFRQVLERCVMVTTSQAELPTAPELLKRVVARRDRPARLAVSGRVLRSGVIRVGDRVRIIE
jgi:uncharacterized protein YcbX